MTQHLTNKEELIISGQVIYIETISNIEDLFENLLKKDPEHEDIKDERIPYWADLWPSAVALSEYISEKKIVFQGLKVLELGCGLGLPGIVAGRLGAKLVLTDYIQEALDLARHNWSLNNIDSAEFIRMDWRKPDTNINADIVIASDIAYEKKSFEDLVAAFKSLLAPGKKIIISEPDRAFAQSFFYELRNRGFNVKTETRSLIFRSHRYTIHVHELEFSGA